ncbi:hypothetical protein PX52LOC_01172 [Limnoglobus roseus]|uniref:Uncharacterized protein n=1 Tax=Limnoglobus roseus TaxID=2598579 RepID=A0A5C1A6F1_9BACT|nr:hypothetical protein PX52LOC_01172 [Limnoglobus roseus]
MRMMTSRELFVMGLALCGFCLLMAAFVSIGVYVGTVAGGDRRWQIFGGFAGFATLVLFISRVVLRETSVETGCLVIIMAFMLVLIYLTPLR